MSYSYMEIIANGMHIPIEDVSNIPLNIALVDANYSMAFIDCENDDCLGINYTIKMVQNILWLLISYILLMWLLFINKMWI